MTRKELLESVKIYLSPITNQGYLCIVKNGIIQERKEILEDDLFDFLVGSSTILSQKYGKEFYIEDSKKRIDIKITEKEKNDEEKN